MDVPLTIIATRTGYVAARREGLTASAANGKGKAVKLILRRGLEAHGRVVDESGAPVAAAEITLSRIEEHRMAGAAVSIGDDPDAVRTARSGADGRFTLAALDGGKYQATVKHPSYASLIVPGLNVRGPAPADWSPFVLRPPAPVAGVVRSKKGDPVSGARISAWGEGGSDEATTDGDGRFALAGFPAGASITMNVRADGFAPAKQAAKAPASDLAIVLSTAATVRGRVEDAGTRQAVADFSIGGRVERTSYIESRAVRSEDGSFEIPDVAPGKLTLNVEAPGYLAGSLSGIELGEGEVKEGVIVSLKKGRAVSGRVLDPRGNAVANATVSWRRTSAWDSSGFVVGPSGMFAMVSNAATTDADGRFQYDAVPPEKLIFKATHPDFLDAERIVDATAESEVDLTLSDGASISGRVVSGSAGAPLGGTDVILSATGAAPMALSNDETRADDAGGFRFDHLKAGRFKVTARSESGLSGTTDVVLAEGQSDDGVIVQLAGGATIRGVVTGLPPEKLSGVEIHAYQSSFSAVVDAEPDGTFAISGVPPGAVTVIASQKSWAPGSRSVSKSVEVPEGAGDVPVEISFQGESRLEVRVTRGTQPQPGLYVSVRPDPFGSPGAQVYGQTDGDGRAAFDDLPDGAYTVDARSSGSQGGRASRTIAISGDTSIEIAVGGGSISGTVTDAASGEPLADAGVSAETGQESSNWAVPSAKTDSQGRYSIDSLDAGDVQVTARRDGYRQKTLAATVADSPIDLSFALAKGGGLPVHATDGLAGTPLSSLWALAFSDSGAIAFSGVVPLDGQGNGEVASLAPGSYALHLFSSGYAPRTFASASVPSTSPVEVAMTPGGRVEVHAAAASTARLVDASGATYVPSTSRLDGRLTIAPPLSVWDHVTPGSYRLIVDGPEGNTEHSLTVREGETTRLELEPL
jgi:5-hydroxyisourate hydrolase-like protein (transthyretin family)